MGDKEKLSAVCYASKSETFVKRETSTQLPAYQHLPQWSLFSSLTGSERSAHTSCSESRGEGVGMGVTWNSGRGEGVKRWV